MKLKPVVLRQTAARGIDGALDYYLQEGGQTVARGFIVALEKAWRHIRRHPATGALRYAEELGITGLRFWPLDRFPWLIFYIEREEVVDVLAVLHEKRDIPPSLRPEPPI